MQFLGAIDLEKINHYWIATSNDDFVTMKKLFKAQSYSWSLFIGHITIEKLLKALYIEIHEKHAPRTHNLYRLAELCHIEPKNFSSD